MGVLAGLEEYPGRVIMLEGGALDETPDHQELNTLETTKLRVKRDSRVRAFGGTTHRWTGGWKPHDAFDFVEKEWIPLSGWPISRADLEPFFTKAVALFHAPPAGSYEPKRYWPENHAHLETSVLATTIVPSIAKPFWNFGNVFTATLETDETKDVLVCANVTRITGRTDHHALEVKTLSGNSFEVRARVVVVAAGGIENARLLLHSRLGNELVGRYYMDHPKVMLGSVTLAPSISWEGIYWNIPQPFGHARAGIQLTETAQRELHVLNSYLRFEPAESWGWWQRVVHRVFPARMPIRRFAMMNFLEQAPHPDNRVRLSTKLDAFGNPLAAVDWQLYPIDVESIRVLHEAVASEMATRGIGTVESPLLSGAPPETWSGIVKDASHHMGTTRMGTDASYSVVDTHCQVHGVPGLFVAGSSVFPTGGFANPVATSVALSLRLGEHLRKRFLGV